MGRDVHSSMFSIQHFLCRPRRRPPSRVPRRVDLERLLWRVACPNRASFRLLTVVRRGSLLNRLSCFPDNPLVKELSYRPSELTFFHSIFFMRAQFYHTDFRTSWNVLVSSLGLLLVSVLGSFDRVAVLLLLFLLLLCVFVRGGGACAAFVSCFWPWYYLQARLGFTETNYLLTFYLSYIRLNIFQLLFLWSWESVTCLIKMRHRVDFSCLHAYCCLWSFIGCVSVTSLPHFMLSHCRIGFA